MEIDASQALPEVTPIEPEIKICRICSQSEDVKGSGQGGKGNSGSLYYPCNCSGSMKYVHEHCLISWLDLSGNKTCEVCKYQFKFQAVWKQGTPDQLPISDVINGLLKTTRKTIACFFHQLLVAFVWLFVLPITVSTIYESAVPLDESGGSLTTFQIYTRLFRLTSRIIRLNIQFSDWYIGLTVVLLNFLTIVGMLYLREQLHLAIERSLNENEEDLSRELKQQGDKKLNEYLIKKRLYKLEDTIPLESNSVNVSEANMSKSRVEASTANAPWDDNTMDDWSASDSELPPEGFTEYRENPPIPEIPVEDDNDWTDEEDQDDPVVEDQRPQGLLVDITWQRVTGVDGTYAFLEHVFYAYILNMLCLWVLWFGPMWLGKFTLRITTGLSFLPRLLNAISSLVYTIIGYSVIISAFGTFAMLRQIMYIQQKLPGLYQTSYYSYQIYIHLKVAILMLVELIFYPSIIGVWLDICAIQFLNHSLDNRLLFFEKNVLTSMFFHWLAGMIVVFQFVKVIMSIRQVTRPGLIWFVRNLEDHEYSPLKDMMENNIFVHLKRFCYTFAMLGWVIFVCVWIPTKVVKQFDLVQLSGYNTTRKSTKLASEYSGVQNYFVLFQVIIPLLNLDIGQKLAKKIFIAFIKLWAEFIGKILGLQSYLVGLENAPQTEIGQIHQPVLKNRTANGRLPGGGQPFQLDPYRRKHAFIQRVVAMLVILVFTMYSTSTCTIFIPTCTGRWIIGHMAFLLPYQRQRIHDEVIYSWMFGVCAIWTPIYVGHTCYEYGKKTFPVFFNRSRTEHWQRVKQGLVYTGKMMIFCVIVGMVMPLILGSILCFVIVTPLRQDGNVDTLMYITNDWIFGVLVQKIACGICLVVPEEWGWRDVLQPIYVNGQPQLLILVKVCFKIIHNLILIWAIPHLIAFGVYPLLISDKVTLGNLQTTIYPTLLSLLLGLDFAKWQCTAFQSLCAKFKQNKYLIGNKLVNRS